MVVLRLLAPFSISVETSTLTAGALAATLAGVGLALHATRVAPYQPVLRTRRLDLPPWSWRIIELAQNMP